MKAAFFEDVVSAVRKWREARMKVYIFQRAQKHRNYD